MGDADGFLLSIAAVPEDDTPRLVYADWLEEHGESARAEFIRLQCEESHLIRFDDAHNALRLRIRELFTAHGQEWLAAEWPEVAPGAPVDGLALNRGFFCRVSVADRGLGPDRLREITRTRPLLALVRWWDLSGNPIGSAGLRELAESPWLGKLQRLVLRRCDCGLDGWEALAASPHLSSLIEVTVTCLREESYTGPDFVTIESQMVFDADRANALRAIFHRHGRGAVLTFD
jgi:uncharacterized protein (TIGR02996 family)